MFLFGQATAWLSLIRQQRGCSWSGNSVVVFWLSNSLVVSGQTTACLSLGHTTAWLSFGQATTWLSLVRQQRGFFKSGNRVVVFGQATAWLFFG